MEHGTARIFCLQAFLMIHRFKDIARVIDGQLRRVRVVRIFVARRDDVRIMLLVVACKAVGCAFGGSCFQVEKLSRFFLIIGKPIAHVYKHFFGKGFSARMDEVYSEEIQAAFVHAA